MHATLPATCDIVLIGGGHTHALLLRRWGMNGLAGTRLTLINPGPTAPYTGMLPGFVAGHYTRDELDIDLVRLARFAGARLILGRATAIDRQANRIAIDDQILGARSIGYDLASLDIGIHSHMSDLPGFAEHAVAAKPLGRFADAWARHRRAGDPAAGMAVLGGGVGGVELAMAMRHGLGGGAGTGAVTVIDSGQALSGLGERARARLLAELERNRVTLIEGARASRITAQGVDLADGRHVPAAFVTGAAGARPHGWLAATGLDLTDGHVTVSDRLQSSDEAIFAAGDCAHLAHAPRPKAGVFAVREAPVLHHNLRSAASGGELRRYTPQKHYLKLVSTGRRSAVAERAGLAVSGDLLWRWKDRIDRAFMRKLDDLSPMPAPALPRRRTLGLEAHAGQEPCGGCAAKVGRGTLARALAALPQVAGPEVETGAGDDAAILRMGDVRQVLTVDQLRAVTEDPALMAWIAAHHALGDCLAMGATPQAALSVLTLPRLSPRLEARMLAEITAAAGAAFEAAGAAVVGGHSATGPELQLGFVVTGRLDGAATPLSGARPGDALILTKPLGTGILLAAEMQLAARGADVAATLRSMATPQIRAVRCLARAHAMTDVTGFGLAGHLMGLCEASAVSADLDLAALPLLPGAAALLRAGIRSTLHVQNREVAALMRLPDDPLCEILFDPQTAGGLLAALPEDAVEPVLGDLPEARRIGTLAAGPPAIRIG